MENGLVGERDVLRDARRTRRHGNPARHRYLRAFLTWLETAQPRFCFHPYVVRRRKAYLLLAFKGLTRRVVVEIWERSWPACGPQSQTRGRHRVTRERQYVFAVCFEPWPYSRIDDANCLHGHNFEWPFGYNPEAGHLASGSTSSRNAHREAVWREHLFEPFLQWVNEELVKADVIVVTKIESHRSRVLIAMDQDIFSPTTRTEPDYNLNYGASLAQAGDRLCEGDPMLEETIEYIEVVALRDGEAYSLTADGTLARIETMPAVAAWNAPIQPNFQS